MQKSLVLSCLHKQKILVAVQEKTSKIKSKIKKSIAPSKEEEMNISPDTYQQISMNYVFFNPNDIEWNIRI